ncbi:Tubulin-folding cofactor C [Acorus gramineus]|uniref:Tubulin-folding cofactor C n=1 Tax=Acorus gramineus TaxID=55184 RepID=A0AAV9AIJ4_ACOGR|nr:Tubulin-folding cofactor C [Acorus gramineus]
MDDDGEHEVLNSIPPAKTLDPTAHKKHLAMVERLSKGASAVKPSLDSSSSAADAPPPFESTKSFLDRFSDSKRSIESDLLRLRSQISDPGTGSDSKPDLEKVSAAISDLERLVAENSYFLPPYEVRSSLKAVSSLKESLESVNSEILPRKKFSFRNKSSKKERSDQLVIEKSNFTVQNPNFSVRDSPGFRDKEGVVLGKHFRRDSDEAEGDFTLADLESCEIHITGRFRALFVHRLKNCRVFVGPVLGSILIENVESCLFMLASHQIRIHEAKGTDFYLRVRSRPIIENCSGVRVAPYRLFYEGIERDLRDSGLEDETENWANVDDFRWLRAVQSPNWCVLPEEERVVVVDISASEPN